MGLGTQTNSNHPRHKTPRHPETPWPRPPVLLWFCSGSALTDCQKHEVRADPFEIGCEPTDAAYHSATASTHAGERRQQALNRGRPACSFEMRGEARAVKGRRYLRFRQLHVPCQKEIRTKPFCLVLAFYTSAVRLAHQRAVVPSRRRESPACLCQFPTLPQIGFVGLSWSRH